MQHAPSGPIPPPFIPVANPHDMRVSYAAIAARYAHVSHYPSKRRSYHDYDSR